MLAVRTRLVKTPADSLLFCSVHASVTLSAPESVFSLTCALIVVVVVVVAVVGFLAGWMDGRLGVWMCEWVDW